MTTDQLPPCPNCASVYTYSDGTLMICPECAHEWSAATASGGVASDDVEVTRDSVGNVLEDGDTVIVTTTMKIKGASQPLKAGTKVKNIRLVGGDHDIDCKIPGFGAMKLKSSIVKKA